MACVVRCHHGLDPKSRGIGNIHPLTTLEDALASIPQSWDPPPMEMHHLGLPGELQKTLRTIQAT